MPNKSRVAAGGGAAFAAAMLLAVPFIADREGEGLTSYRDVAGVWTICHGETLGVTPGMTRTREECEALTGSRVGQFMAEVAGTLTVEVPPETLAAHTSFVYNIGLDGYRRSSALRLTNEGKIREGCEAMRLWYRAGGRDCRARNSGCHGLWKRRLDEVGLCLSGTERGGHGAPPSRRDGRD